MRNATDLDLAIPIPDPTRVGSWDGVRLSAALAKVKLAVKGLGTDITHGTEFYTPIVTLLARNVGTRRQDVVYSLWPLLGCPFFHYHQTIPKKLAEGLAGWQIKHDRAPRLWEIIDFLQAVAKWDLASIIEWVKRVEGVMRTKADLVTLLQAAADAAKERHDREGMRENTPEMSEGIVIPATVRVS